MSFTKINLLEVEDSAKKFGHADNHEARFASKQLELEKSGLSYQKLHPGKRSPFGHKHAAQEEVHIILSGNGRVKLDEEIVELMPLDVVRVSAGTMRAFEAGPDGLEMIIYGAPKTEERDFTIVNDWWKD